MKKSPRPPKRKKKPTKTAVRKPSTLPMNGMNALEGAMTPVGRRRRNMGA